MEYSNEIVINLPREEIMKFWMDPEMMKKWSPTLETIELVEGKAFTQGAKSKLIFKVEKGKKPVEMLETIIKIEIPTIFNYLFEMDGVKNWSDNEFRKIDANKTQWIAHNKFAFDFDITDQEKKLIEQFSKQTMEDMEHFKRYVENI